MTRHIMAGILLAVSCCLCFGQEQLRVIDSMEDASLYTPAQPELGHKWTGEVAVDNEEFKEGARSLRFSVHSARSGEESFPQWGRSFDREKNDWTGYRALRYWVKVTSRDPGVKQKMMCIVVYNGDAPLQQFVRHNVPVGEWVQLTDNIVTYNRDRVRGIVIYLYETDPSRQDDYTWWVDGLELIPSKAGEMEFDTQFVQTRRRAAQAPLCTIGGGAGPSIGLDDTGRVVTMGMGDRVLYSAGEQVEELSGLMLRDHKSGPQPRPVEGRVAQREGAIEQQQTYEDGLSVSATLRPVGDRIDVSVWASDTRPQDRPLTLYFALPVDATGWRWWDDVATARLIEGQTDYWHSTWSGQGARWSPYPFSCISGTDAALSLSVPLSLPRVQRTVYDPRLKLYYIAYDFCLTPDAVKQQQTARFEFSLFGGDPSWGLRDTVRKYYEYYPEAFEKRVPKDGGWGCWGTYEGNQNIADLGFMYHWGPDSRGSGDAAKSVAYDNQIGVLSLPYIEWTNLHVSMEGYEKADNAAIMERIRWIADPARTGSLDKLSYLYPYDDRLGPDKDKWMREVFTAYLASLIYDRAGMLYGGADQSEFGLLVAKYIPFNADPDIVGGAGDLFLNKWWPAIEEYYADKGVRIDGFGWDNFYVRGTCFDHRREHFAAADEPLLFDPESLEPVIAKDMATYELQREVVKRLREMGRYLIANQSNVSLVPATLPLLDVFGYEWNVQNTGVYARTMAHHKPVCTLPCAPAHYEDPFVREHLLYGVWPGGYYDTSAPAYLELMRKYIPIVRRQSAAGWEPVTLARVDSPQAQVEVERFGGGDGKELLFSLKNRGGVAADVRLRIDASLVQAGVQHKVTELVSGAELGTVTRESASVEVPIGAGEVVVVAVEVAG